MRSLPGYSACWRASSRSAVGLGGIAASILINLTSVSAALVIVGALCPILVLSAWRRLRHLDRYIGKLDQEIGLLQGVPMLPVATARDRTAGAGTRTDPCAGWPGAVSSG